MTPDPADAGPPQDMGVPATPSGHSSETEPSCTVSAQSVSVPNAIERAIDVVRTEIASAIVKFPTWPTDPLHAVAVVGEEAGELTKATLQAVYEPHKSTSDDVFEEAVQTAAMAIRFLASINEYEYAEGVQHAQLG